MQKYQYYTITKYIENMPILRGAEKTVRSTFEINLLWLRIPNFIGVIGDWEAKHLAPVAV